MLRPLWEGNKVRLELPVLGNEFILRECTLRELLGKSHFRRFLIDSFWLILYFFKFSNRVSVFFKRNYARDHAIVTLRTLREVCVLFELLFRISNIRTTSGMAYPTPSWCGMEWNGCLFLWCFLHCSCWCWRNKIKDEGASTQWKHTSRLGGKKRERRKRHATSTYDLDTQPPYYIWRRKGHRNVKYLNLTH